MKLEKIKIGNRYYTKDELLKIYIQICNPKKERIRWFLPPCPARRARCEKWLREYLMILEEIKKMYDDRI